MQYKIAKMERKLLLCILTIARFLYFVFAMNEGGDVNPPPAGVSKLSIMKLVKKQRIALDEYSRSVPRFLILGQYLTRVNVKGSL